MKAIAAYVRVSTNRRLAEIGQDTELQKRDITAYLAAKGITDFQFYEDQGYSGRKDNRPALKRLMADCRAGKIEKVVIWKLDRFFRSLRHLINTLDELSKLGVQFVAVRDSIDLGTNAGRLMMQILGAIAEFEAAVIIERTKSGLENAVAKGKTLGRRPFELDASMITKLFASGHTMASIAKQFNVSIKTVQRRIRDALAEAA